MKAIKTAVKASEVVAPKFTDINRTYAVILWKYGKQKAAFKVFLKAIKQGERLDAKLELSRTYFELGKFLSDPEVNFNQLENKPAEYYLGKAKSMFEELD